MKRRKEFKYMKWTPENLDTMLNKASKNAERQLRTMERNTSPEEKRLLRDFNASELYIGSIRDKGKRLRAIRKQREILQRLDIVRKRRR